MSAQHQSLVGNIQEKPPEVNSGVPEVHTTNAFFGCLHGCIYTRTHMHTHTQKGFWKMCMWQHYQRLRMRLPHVQCQLMAENGFLEILESPNDYGSVFNDTVSSSHDFTKEYLENSGTPLNFSSSPPDCFSKNCHSVKPMPGAVSPFSLIPSVLASSCSSLHHHVGMSVLQKSVLIPDH